LRAALESGQVAGAGLDVLQVEPMETNCPLLGVPGCMITPHVAWAPVTTRERLLNIVAENLRCFLDGKPIHVVNG
jgi:glycerate dehydrogenase